MGRITILLWVALTLGRPPGVVAGARETATMRFGGGPGPFRHLARATFDGPDMPKPLRREGLLVVAVVLRVLAVRR
jgi:hypothetical protein